MSEDPIGFEAGDANQYAYVGNAPTIGTDPDGLEQRPGTGGFWDSVSNSWRGMQDTYTSLIVTYWYGLPNEGTRIMEDAYNRGPLGQSKDAPGWCYYGTRGSLGVSTVATGGIVVRGVVAAVRGEEMLVSHGSKTRVAPFGNRTGHPTGQYPHYHRGVPDPKTPGQSVPGQGIGRHRPWDTKCPDKSFWDRF